MAALLSVEWGPLLQYGTYVNTKYIVSKKSTLIGRHTALMRARRSLFAVERQKFFRKRFANTLGLNFFKNRLLKITQLIASQLCMYVCMYVICTDDGYKVCIT